MEELKRLRNDLKASKELRKKLEEICNRVKENGQVRSDGEIMVTAAKELGYNITIAALEQDMAEAEEMDLDALEAVAGGDQVEQCAAGTSYACTSSQMNVDEYGHDASCYAEWHCGIILRHTESTSKKIVCWSDYACMHFSHSPFEES